MAKKSSSSIKSRLKNLAKNEKLVAHLVYLNHAFKRFLYRLSISKYRDKLILKGGLRLYCEEKVFRQTRDIDFLGLQFSKDEK